MASVSIVLVSLGATLSLLYLVRTQDFRPLLSHQGLVPFITLAFALLGATVASRHPRNVIGWLYLATASLYGLNAIAAGHFAYASLDRTNWLPWSAWITWLGRWVWLPAMVLPLGFALLFFPDGRLPSRRWRPLAGATGLGLAGCVLSIALYPGPIESWNILGPNPYGIPGAGSLLEPVLNASAALVAFGLLGALLAVSLRFRRSRGVEREQLKWVVYTSVALFLVLSLVSALAPFFLSPAATNELNIVLGSLFTLGIAVSISIAILHYRLYDIDLVINRTLVYGLLTTAIAGLYGLVVGGLGLLLQARGSLALSLLGVGLAAIAAQPVRERLQRAINRLMYGDRDDPYVVLTRLGQRLEATLVPEAVLPAIVETVAQALRLPYAGVRLQRGQVEATVAEYGQPTNELLRWPLTYQGTRVGELMLSPRAPGEALSPADRRLLDALARQAGVAAHAVQLATALQHSRERLVTAREEERRRLRRDLHDGLGPQLASLTLNLETAKNRLVHDPEAQVLLSQLAARTQAAVADIRRLVYELRPPTLDELGLVQALRESMTQYAPPAYNGLRLVLEAPDQLPPLPAAVEVAVYRIAQEALTNVVRHAGARQCQVRLRLEAAGSWLCLEIQDDGQGVPAVRTPGVGLNSMRERAEELGGTWALDAAVPHGTCVRARLPLSLAAEPEPAYTNGAHFQV